MRVVVREEIKKTEIKFIREGIAMEIRRDESCGERGDKKDRNKI